MYKYFISCLTVMFCVFRCVKFAAGGIIRYFLSWHIWELVSSVQTLPVKIQILALQLYSLLLVFSYSWSPPRLLRSWVRIPSGAWIFVCCDCCVLSGRGICDELITRRGESYRLWCVVVCDLETSRMRRPWPALGRSTTAKIKFREAVFGVAILYFIWIQQFFSCAVLSCCGTVGTS